MSAQLGPLRRVVKVNIWVDSGGRVFGRVGRHA